MEQLRLSEWLGWDPLREENATKDARLLPSDKPGVSLPAMLRRRLDNAGRATCDILAGLDPEARCPLIHASRHGDANFTLSMLKALANQEPLSPTRFSMSVHNATLGVHAIANHHYRPLQALGASGNEFNALLWEARGYLAEGHEAVVIVFSEGTLPGDYIDCTPHPGHACAVGLRLSLTQGRALVAEDATPGAAPTPLDVIDWLGGCSPRLAAAPGWRLEEA
ncbi:MULTISPECIES: beta-ketoacyl synthase chain length factor [unclassified Halomonas]|nr:MULTISPECIES: beta-ketoacyl synthase chain length factor [unclassified Halomonas]MBR9772188.1 beta-ketoacyl synthase chain length factor [Gammaproteobacteria bacterium]MBS8270500.1 hypothetical protein [Halomonas litopenaei]MBY5942486.1 beta-ketoacyl synthase chain length factor [Halomonas sp. DP5N14-9]RQW68933.1 hypothetical protein EBB56_19795 [Halomonas sp. YLB-10]